MHQERETQGHLSASQSHSFRWQGRILKPSLYLQGCLPSTVQSIELGVPLGFMPSFKECPGLLEPMPGLALWRDWQAPAPMLVIIRLPRLNGQETVCQLFQWKWASRSNKVTTIYKCLTSNRGAANGVGHKAASSSVTPVLLLQGPGRWPPCTQLTLSHSLSLWTCV